MILDTVIRPFGRRVMPAVWRLSTLLCLPLLTLALLLSAPASHAQGVELTLLQVSRRDGGDLTLDFIARPSLSRAVEEAMQRGIPLYFVASATVYRGRWYWWDARVAQASRTWRLSYQPLTANWRVSLGGLNQTARSAEEALSLVSRAIGWQIADAEQIDGGGRYYVEFSYRLDASQLPRPMELDLAVLADWRLSVERVLRLE